MIHLARTYASKNQGFTLPAVLVVSLTILIIGLSMTQTSSSVRTSIDSQYYNRLATEAAQSGVAYANYCLVNNSYSQSWGAALSRPDLTQSTDCYGAALAPSITSLIDSANFRVTFSVGDSVGRSDGATLITAEGKVEKLQTGTGNVVDTYTRKIKRVSRSLDFQQGKAVFGYNVSNGTGAFFATLQSDGKFRSAGSGAFGKLGTGNTNDILIPAPYILPAGKIAARAYTNFLSIGYQMFVKTTDGDLYGAGLNDRGQLGDGSTSGAVSTAVKMIIPSGEKVVYVGVGGYSTYVLTDANNIYATGSCDDSLLGTGCTSGSVTTPTRVALPTPNTNDLNTIPAQQMTIDYHSAYVRMQGGRVYGWGNNGYGQLGDGTTNISSVPKQIGTFGDSGQPKATQIAFDGDTIYILDSNGDAWASGRNHRGQLGVGNTANSSTLKKVIIPVAAGKVTRITTDQWFASFLTDSGKVYSAGLNDRGQLGNGSFTNTVSTPVEFILPSGVKATYVYTAGTGTSSTMANTFVIGNNGKVYGAGSNTYGQIGIGSTAARVTTPAAMSVFDGVNVKASDILTGYGTTIISAESGKIYTVGHNDYGQLGNGSTNDTTVPSEPEYLQARAPNYIF